jgi:uncharacterized peroxidase-related enzyme
MPRLTVHDPAGAPEAARPLLEGVRRKLGIVPNLMRVVASSPAALGGYLGFAGALAADGLPAHLRERIALAVAEADGCDDCLAAHSVHGGKAGLTEGDIAAARAGRAADAKDAAALAFARAVLASAGRVDDAALAAVRAAGWGDAAIVEIIAHVALNLFTNSVNNVARTPVDFPAVAPARAA